MMERNIFSPKINTQTNSLETGLKRLLFVLLFLTVGLLPVFFVPSLDFPFAFTKSFMVVIGVGISFIVLLLLFLRQGEVNVVFPWALGSFWIGAILTLSSAVLSGDTSDSLVGFNFEVFTAGFILLGAVLMTVFAWQNLSDRFWLFIFSFLAVSASLVQLHHLVRLLVGPEFLSLGVFNSITASPIGSYNDLAIFSTLTVLVGIVTLFHANISRLYKILVSVLVVISLIPVMLANLFLLWAFLGFISLSLIIYMVTIDVWSTKGTDYVSLDNRSKHSLETILTLVVVAVASFVFVVAGQQVGTYLGELTGVSYLEVRPSVMATVDIGRQVFSEDAFFGTGPNRFADAWRLFKDPSINPTIFWNTDFVAANSYLSTLFITTGLPGALAFIVFIVGLLWTGFKMFIKPEVFDRQWYYLGLVSWSVATFFWLSSLYFVIGTTVVLLGFIMTGLAFYAYGFLNPSRRLSWRWVNDSRNAFLVVTFSFILIIATATTVSEVLRQYAGAVTYAKTINEANRGASVEVVEQGLVDALGWAEKDEYYLRLSELRFRELNTVLANQNPGEAEQQIFQQSSVEGIRLAEQAIEADPTNPNNHVLRASFYGQLTLAGVAEAGERMRSALEVAKSLNPQSPEYDLILAQFLSRSGDLEGAKTALESSLRLKGNYTPSLLLLSQVEVQLGNSEAAIATTRAVITMEPNNPARYFQLGVLLANEADRAGAINAFNRAIELDPQFANARYLLALILVEQNQIEEALAQLRAILPNNQDNTLLNDLISSLESGEIPATTSPTEVTEVVDEETVEMVDDTVTTDRVPETDLLTPVNQVPDTETEEGANTTEETAEFEEGDGEVSEENGNEIEEVTSEEEVNTQ